MLLENTRRVDSYKTPLQYNVLYKLNTYTQIQLQRFPTLMLQFHIVHRMFNTYLLMEWKLSHLLVSPQPPFTKQIFQQVPITMLQSFKSYHAMYD